MNLAGKVAVVTGGSRGLGRDLAGLIHQAGGDVIICARSPEQAEGAGPDQRWYSERHSVDLAVPAQVNAFTDALAETRDHIDILVNNLGYGGRLATLAETTEEELATHVALNLMAPFLLTRKLLPSILSADEGWIVNVASQAGKRAVPRLAAYSATKFALVGMAQALAKELQDTSVRCVTICPGGMATEMRADLFGWEDARKQQPAMSVAVLIRDIMTGAIPVANGAEVLIKEGKIQRIELSPNY